jgi:hypothetical protein
VKVAPQNVTKFITIIALNLVTLKAAAKLELLFDKPASGHPRHKQVTM